MRPDRGSCRRDLGGTQAGMGAAAARGGKEQSNLRGQRLRPGCSHRGGLEGRWWHVGAQEHQPSPHHASSQGTAWKAPPFPSAAFPKASWLLSEIIKPGKADCGWKSWISSRTLLIQHGQAGTASLQAQQCCRANPVLPSCKSSLRRLDSQADEQGGLSTMSLLWKGTAEHRVMLPGWQLYK